MAVFKFRPMDEIINEVRTIAGRLLNEHVLRLKPEEFIAAFVKPEHVDVLRTTESIVGRVGDMYVMTNIIASGVHAKVYISFSYSSPPIIIPSYASEGYRDTAPWEVVDKIVKYVDERVRIGRMFGDAIDALHYLNNNCGNAAAMSVLFPALPSIIDAIDPNPDSTTKKRAKRIVEAKSFGSTPKLPPEVKARMFECSNLIMNTLMLGTDNLPESKTKGEATLKVSSLATSFDDFIYAALGQREPATFV